MEMLNRGEVDVFFYCDYFPNNFISTLLRGSVSHRNRHESIYKNNIMIQFPYVDTFKAGTYKFKKNTPCSFSQKTLSINETTNDMMEDPKRYNLYYLFNDGSFWYNTYKYNEILVCHKSILSQISYEISKVIFERLAMREVDKLILSQTVKIQIHQGALKFIEEVTNDKMFKDF